jgi:large conductance mechanosensitive channel
MGVKQALKEFKIFATSGNMLDLALGVIIGVAFNDVVSSLSKDIIGDLLACFGGAPDMSSLQIKLFKGTIHIGKFLNSLINFIIVAFSLFGIVKLIMFFKLANFRAQGNRECPYCREQIPVDAIRCKFCTSHVKAIIDGDEGSDEREE